MHVPFYLQSLPLKALSTSHPSPTADVKGDCGLPLSFSDRVPQGRDGSRVGRSQEGTSFSFLAPPPAEARGEL